MTLRRGFSLIEIVVVLGLLSLVTAIVWQASPRAAAVRTAEKRADDIQSIHVGLEKIKRTLETARFIVYPDGKSGKPERSLVFRDARDRLTVWAVEGSDLVETCWSPGQKTGIERQVLLPGCDGAFFDFRGPTERVVRLQVFLAGLSFITSVRFFNDMTRRSLEPLEDLFGK